MQDAQNITDDDLLTPNEIAEIWKMCAETVRALCRKKKLAHIRLTDRGIRIRRGDAAAYIAACRTDASK